MKLKVCEYCGTEYSSDRETCPLCGKNEQEAHDAAPNPAKTEPVQNSDRIPPWMWVMTCVLLAVAVLVGLIYFMVSMEYIGGKDDVEPAISVPVVETPVIVEPVDLSCKELTLSQTLLTLDELGSHVFLTALPDPVDCEDEVEFSSRDETIATVDESGMITAVAPGKTEILVACGSVLEICTVVCDFEVEEPEEEEPTDEEPSDEEPVEEEPMNDPVEEEPAQEATLSSVDFTLFRPGEETYLTVKNAPENATITYMSSDPSVATVSDTGKVVAVGDGNATITVTVNGKTLTCIARCSLGTTAETNEAPSGVYHLSHEDVTLGEATNEAFMLYLLDQNGEKVSGATYSSSDTSICTVESSGRVTAVGKGTATVTVTYGGQSYICYIR